MSGEQARTRGETLWADDDPVAFGLEPYQEEVRKTFRAFLEAKWAQHEHESRSLQIESIWRGISDLGGIHIATREEQGGGGGSLVDAVLVAFEVGRVALPSAYAEMVAAARLVDAMNAASLAVEATVDSTGLVVSLFAGSTGSGQSVPGSGTRAFHFLDGFGVVAQSNGRFVKRAARPDRISWSNGLAGEFISGVLPNHTNNDAGREVPRDLVLDWLLETVLLRSSELTGLARGALQMTVSYTSDRKQFGRSIASFQAVRHRLADLIVGVEAAELLCLRAAAESSEDGLVNELVFAASSHASEVAVRAAREGVQLMGGYGFMLEYDAHRYVRAAMVAAAFNSEACTLSRALTVEGEGASADV